MTFQELFDELNLEIFPDRLAENLVPAVTRYYKEALSDLQRWVPCLQTNHVDVYPFRSTYFKCGTTVICGVAGNIKRLYTTCSDGFCQPVQYVPTTFDKLYAWSRRFNELSGEPDQTGLPELPIGFKYPEPTTDQQYRRALRGYYSRYNRNIYVAPWIQSSESVVIEWDGFKKSWSAADEVSFGQMDENQVKRAIAAWVSAQKARYFDHDMRQFEAYKEDYDDAIKTLIYDCRRITHNLEVVYEFQVDAAAVALANVTAGPCGTEAPNSTEEIEAAEAAAVLAVIGDYGMDNAAEGDVADLVKSWSPEIVVTTGDNNYPSGAAGTIDANIGKYYRMFIYPYQGSEPLGSGESDATTNRFFPSLGNHDLDFGFPPTPFLDYFPWLEGKRYYSFVWDLCEFFVLDSGLNTAGTLVETSGNTEVSLQANWLQSAMAASVAKYKIVVDHHPPYTSSSNYTPGTLAMRWPYKQWGADLVLSGHGHNYERLDVDDLTYIVNGAGGAALVGFTTPPLDESEYRYSANYGALKLSVTCDALTAEFYNIAGTLIDSVEITNTNPVLQTD